MSEQTIDSINFLYEVLEDVDNSKKKNLIVYQEGFNKGKCAGRMIHIPWVDETKSEILKKGIEEFARYYNLDTPCEVTIKDIDSKEAKLEGLIWKRPL